MRGISFAAACRRLGPRLMRDLGLSDVQAAGPGNLGHETGFRPPPRSPRVARLPRRMGAAQWTGPGASPWRPGAGARPRSRRSRSGLRYLCAELRTTEAPALAALRTHDDPRGRHRDGLAA